MKILAGMKRPWAAGLLAGLVGLCFGLPALAATGAAPTPAAIQAVNSRPLVLDDYEYTVEDGKATLRRYLGAEGTVTVPALLAGYPVTAIGDFAFYRRDTLTSVMIPLGVTEIHREAFSFCSSLIKVDLPASLRMIGDKAFLNCKFTSINLPESLEEIGDNAFGNTPLQELHLPGQVEDLSRGAFMDCRQLRAITVAAENSQFSARDGVLYNKDLTVLLHYPRGKDAQSFSVPAGVESLADAAVFGNPHLSGISLPNTLQRIGISALAHNTGLKSLIIPDSVESVGDCAFEYNNNLTIVVFLGSRTGIGRFAFNRCLSLNSVTLPIEAAEIPPGLFAGCSGLKKIVLPDTVSTLGYGAFQDCLNLAAVTMPGALKTIESKAFYNCKALPAIYIPGKTSQINNYVFANCVGLSSVTLPASLSVLGEGAFYSCSGLMDARFSGNAPAIGSSLFQNCPADFRIYFPQGKPGWTTPVWFGYPSQPYASLNLLPLVPARPVTFYQPAADLLTEPLRPDPFRPLADADQQADQPSLLTDTAGNGSGGGGISAGEGAELPSQPGSGRAEVEIRLFLGHADYLLNGRVKVMDTAPILEDGRFYLPIRYVAAPLGAESQWDGNEQKVTVSMAGTTIEMWIGSNLAWVNGVEIMIDSSNPDVKPVRVPPGRTMLPLRFISENLGCRVFWNQARQEAVLSR